MVKVGLGGLGDDFWQDVLAVLFQPEATGAIASTFLNHLFLDSEARIIDVNSLASILSNYDAGGIVWKLAARAQKGACWMIMFTVVVVPQGFKLKRFAGDVLDFFAAAMSAGEWAPWHN